MCVKTFSLPDITLNSQFGVAGMGQSLIIVFGVMQVACKGVFFGWLEALEDLKNATRVVVFRVRT